MIVAGCSRTPLQWRFRMGHLLGHAKHRWNPTLPSSSESSGVKAAHEEGGQIVMASGDGV